MVPRRELAARVEASASSRRGIDEEPFSRRAPRNHTKVFIILLCLALVVASLQYDLAGALTKGSKHFRLGSQDAARKTVMNEVECSLAEAARKKKEAKAKNYKRDAIRRNMFTIFKQILGM